MKQDIAALAALSVPVQEPPMKQGGRVMLPEHKMPTSWQARHERATVAAGATQFQAQAPMLLALGPIRTNLGEASADADLMQRMFDATPCHQYCAVAQAMQSLR